MKTELGLVVATKTPAAKPELVARLIAELKKEGRAMLAVELAKALFGKETENAKRDIRRIAKAARPRVVSSPGSEGYMLWAACPIADLWHNVNSMEASAKALWGDAQKLRKAIHSGYRGEAGDDGQKALPI